MHKERKKLYYKDCYLAGGITDNFFFPFSCFPSNTLNTLVVCLFVCFSYFSFKNSYKSQEFAKNAQEGPQDPSPNFLA